jgi:hypothetical protein
MSSGSLEENPPPSTPPSSSQSPPKSVMSQILTDNQWRGMLFMFLALTVLAISVGILFPGTLLVNPYGRFFLLVLVAFSMGIALFLLFPADFVLTGIPGIDLGIKLAGPVVLVIILFRLLYSYMPIPSGGKLFLKGSETSSSVAMLTPPVIRFEPSTAQGITRIHMLIKLEETDQPSDPYNPDKLAGFYIEYNPDQAPKQFTTSIKVRGQTWGKASFDLNSAGAGVVQWEPAEKAAQRNKGDR